VTARVESLELRKKQATPVFLYLYVLGQECSRQKKSPAEPRKAESKRWACRLYELANNVRADGRIQEKTGPNEPYKGTAFYDRVVHGVVGFFCCAVLHHLTKCRDERF